MPRLGDLIRREWGHQSSPKGEGVGFGAGIEKADLKGTIGNRTSLPNELTYSLACTAHPPPTAARVATTAKVAAMPASIGRPLLTNGLSDRANTNRSRAGYTG
jgi:hypothetical protein